MWGFGHFDSKQMCLLVAVGILMYGVILESGSNTELQSAISHLRPIVSMQIRLSVVVGTEPSLRPFTGHREDKLRSIHFSEVRPTVLTRLPKTRRHFPELPLDLSVAEPRPVLFMEPPFLGLYPCKEEPLMPAQKTVKPQLADEAFFVPV